MTSEEASLESVIGEITGTRAGIRRRQPVSGGSIHRTSVVELDDGRRYFIKESSGGPAGIFDTEAAGLAALRSAGALRVPIVAGTGRSGGTSFLLMEEIRPGRQAPGFFRRLGEGLATIHRTATAPAFGFDHDNFIGSTPQPNPRTTDWVTFFREHRLRFQLELARTRGESTPELERLGDRLLARLDALIGEPQEPPCLLHGDLWGGNFLADERGEPALIDPAVYHGHREADLAMTRLFGGFPPDFYHAYHDTYPLAAGWEERMEIYKLYHLLNHLNLFGSSYRSGCLKIMETYAG